MKKMMLMAAMAAIATSAFAQDDLVKEAQKLKNSDPKAALEKITPALTNSATTDKATAWNTVAEIQYKIFSDQQGIQLENQVKGENKPIDEAAMNTAIAEALKAALKCDEFDRQPNAKGKIKPRFRKTNQQTYKIGRQHVINAGLWAYNNKDYAKALEYWGAYIDSKNDPLFEGVDFSDDKNYSEICYYAALTAYQAKDYATAQKYAKMAAEDPAKAADANEILLFSQKETCKTAADTVNYVNTLKDLHTKNPADEKVFGLLVDYYANSPKKDEAKAFAAAEVASNPNSKMAHALMGQLEMEAKNWDVAYNCFYKAQEIDPEFILCSYNAGVCLISKAQGMNDQLADKRTGNLSADNLAKIQDVMKQALPLLEKCRAKDADQLTVRWAYPLYQVYYALGDKEKAAEVGKIAGISE